MVVYNTPLYLVLGIQFEFKRVWDEQAPFWASILSSYNVAGNTPAIREALVEKIVNCGPAMGFSVKQYSYQFLKLIDAAGRATWEASPEALARLDKTLKAVQGYSGVEGEEDYNFMVALFNYMEAFIYAFD